MAVTDDFAARSIGRPIRPPIGPFEAPALERSTARHTARRTARDMKDSPTALLLWRETLHVLGSHSAPILFYAVGGILGASILGALLGSALLVRAYMWTEAYTPYINILIPQLLIQAAAGVFLASFAQGAITWIALRAGAGQPADVPGAFHATLARWPALLASSLLYGVVIALGTAGLLLLLRELRLDASNIGRVNPDLVDINRAVLIRGGGLLMPDPGEPFTELFSYLRYNLSRSSYYAWYFYRNTLGSADAEWWLLGLGSAALLVAAETLLRLRSVSIMQAEPARGLRAVLDGIRANRRHFWFVLGQVWLLRAATTLVTLLFIVLPTTLVQGYFVPAYARLANSFWPYSASNAVFAFTSAAAGMLLIVFGVVYDTRLYAHLCARSPAHE
jgi:hypothetical protein